MNVPPTQLRQPKLAEIVADSLRQRILNGELVDGQLLPNQDSFIAEFGVSRPSMREALRILETEGLITVRRGNVGGAVVHSPQASHVAHTLTLVLEARGISIDDVGDALKQLEGTCAGLCARREDRATTVVAALRETNARALASIDDWPEFIRATSDFHQALIDGSGNQTLRLMVGSLEATWLGHVGSWAQAATVVGSAPDRDYRRRGIEAHERLTDLIADGDVAATIALAESHFDPHQFRAQAARAQDARSQDATSTGAAATAGAPDSNPSTSGS